MDDNIVVWLSRVIAQDVNIFEGADLLASSERNLFASGLLPTRTPGDAYRAILLEGRPSHVGRESAGGLDYIVAAAPVRVRDRDAILTVPLTSRQQETEAQIQELDRRVLLAALLFIMLGAGIGYYMAERIADPVNRLMRATKRIAQAIWTRACWRPRRTSCDSSSMPSTAWPSISSVSVRSSSAPTGSPRGPRWRVKWLTTSRIR